MSSSDAIEIVNQRIIGVPSVVALGVLYSFSEDENSYVSKTGDKLKWHHIENVNYEIVSSQLDKLGVAEITDVESDIIYINKDNITYFYKASAEDQFSPGVYDFQNNKKLTEGFEDKLSEDAIDQIRKDEFEQDSKTLDQIKKDLESASLSQSMIEKLGALSLPELISEISELSGKLQQENLTYPSITRYMEDISTGNRRGIKELIQRDELMDSRDTLTKLKNGLISPRRIIGVGGTKAEAIKWISENIERLEFALKYKGFAYFTNISNYRYTLREILENRKDIDFKTDEDLQIIEREKYAADIERNAKIEELSRKAKEYSKSVYGIEHDKKRLYEVQTHAFHIQSYSTEAIVTAAELGTPEKMYQYLVSSAEAKRIDKGESLSDQLDFRRSRKAGVNFTYAEFKPRKGYVLIELEIDVSKKRLDLQIEENLRNLPFIPNNKEFSWENLPKKALSVIATEYAGSIENAKTSVSGNEAITKIIEFNNRLGVLLDDFKLNGSGLILGKGNDYVMLVEEGRNNIIKFDFNKNGLKGYGNYSSYENALEIAFMGGFRDTMDNNLLLELSVKDEWQSNHSFEKLKKSFPLLARKNRLFEDSEIIEAVIPTDKHYSEKVIDNLIEKHGWDRTGPTSARFTHTGVQVPGEINPDGSIIYSANFDERKRYLEISLGLNYIKDFDCRDANLEEVADDVHIATLKDIAKKQVENKLPVTVSIPDLGSISSIEATDIGLLKREVEERINDMEVKLVDGFVVVSSGEYRAELNYKSTNTIKMSFFKGADKHPAFEGERELSEDRDISITVLCNLIARNINRLRDEAELNSTNQIENAMASPQVLQIATEYCKRLGQTDTPRQSHRDFANAIISKDMFYIDEVVINGLNKVAESYFFELIGVSPKPKKKSDMIDFALSWVGISKDTFELNKLNKTWDRRVSGKLRSSKAKYESIYKWVDKMFNEHGMKEIETIERSRYFINPQTRMGIKFKDINDKVCIDELSFKIDLHKKIEALKNKINSLSTSEEMKSADIAGQDESADYGEITKEWQTPEDWYENHFCYESSDTGIYIPDYKSLLDCVDDISPYLDILEEHNAHYERNILLAEYLGNKALIDDAIDLFKRYSITKESTPELYDKSYNLHQKLSAIYKSEQGNLLEYMLSRIELKFIHSNMKDIATYQYRELDDKHYLNVIGNPEYVAQSKAELTQHLFDNWSEIAGKLLSDANKGLTSPQIGVLEKYEKCSIEYFYNSKILNNNVMVIINSSTEPEKKGLLTPAGHYLPLDEKQENKLMQLRDHLTSSKFRGSGILGIKGLFPQLSLDDRMNKKLSVQANLF